MVETPRLKAKRSFAKWSTWFRVDKRGMESLWRPWAFLVLRNSLECRVLPFPPLNVDFKSTSFWNPSPSRRGRIQFLLQITKQVSPYPSRGFLVKRKGFLTASRPLVFRFEFWFKPIEMSNGKNVKYEKEPSPEDPSPEGGGQLRDGRSHHSIPIDKS